MPQTYTCQGECGTIMASAGMCSHCQIENSVEYEMSAEDARIIDRACKPLLHILNRPGPLQVARMNRQQKICNDKWAKIATKMGADPRTVRPSDKDDNRLFLAVPLGKIK